MPRSWLGPGQYHRPAGGYGNPIHGWLDEKPLTIAFGWGREDGHILVAEGHVNMGTFMQPGNHTHYNPDEEPYEGIKEKLKYRPPNH